ncbi:RluA family pseudouridine synthase [Pseudostreptobacillus hongkongensis]|uniref:RluA family pseudouridine synthase n=1 Tax=Pseudostreptobacillus hongkongensis TaxID=1162717 RepID=UPI000829ECE7|nr:RluA family pseudouridine synthase [Pseudostreptobacillus hongkongensis]
MLIEENIESRLDVYLSSILDESRTRIQDLIKSGNILVNGLKTKGSYKLVKGDELTVNIPELKELDIKPQNIKLDIVYEDKYLLVVNKPAGMIVHPAKGHVDGTLVNALLYNIKDLSGINGTLRPGIVHRLDKDTSGLIIVAKDDKTHQLLTDMFKNKEIEKIYYAIIKMDLKKESGRIETYIGRDKKDRKKMSVNSEGKFAITNFERIDHNAKYSLLKINLETGRTHQIRVHMSHFFAPIIGDSVYGRKDEFNRQMLHAYSLKFRHPITKKDMYITSRLHNDFIESLNKTKLRIDIDGY